MNRWSTCPSFIAVFGVSRRSEVCWLLQCAILEACRPIRQDRGSTAARRDLSRLVFTSCRSFFPRAPGGQGRIGIATGKKSLVVGCNFAAILDPQAVLTWI